MHYSPVADATFFPCPACPAQVGQHCWPRAVDDSPWCHSARIQVMQYNGATRDRLMGQFPVARSG